MRKVRLFKGFESLSLFTNRIFLVLSLLMITLFKKKRDIFLFDRSLLSFLWGGIRKSQFQGFLFYWFSRHLIYQYKAYRLRKRMQNKGIHVPPLLIISLTRKCNLNCRGCYSKVLRPDKEGEMDAQKLLSVLQEARSLGISIVLFAGGEPMMRFDDLLFLNQTFPEMLMPVFTNGLLLQKKQIELLKRRSNLIPVISLEGGEEDTDLRRGPGISDLIRSVQNDLKNASLFYGISMTVDTYNLDSVLEDSFIHQQIQKGAGIFFFIEFVPVEPGTENKVLTEIQREKLQSALKQLDAAYPALFVSLPGDEKKFGGCLAAGRGFLHINPEGKVEACPFAPFSDSSLQDISLKEALHSKLMEKIRESHHLLTETTGGCALWNHKDELGLKD